MANRHLKYGHRSAYRPKILALLADHKQWTINELNIALKTEKNSSVSSALYALENEGLVTRMAGRVNTFRLSVDDSPEAQGPTDNPFCWQTYQPYTPQCPPPKSCQL